MSRRSITGGILAGALALIYVFAIGPAYHLWQAERSLKPVLTAARRDVHDKDAARLLRVMPSLLAPLTAAHIALGRLAYVVWIPGVGAQFRSASATVNSAYWTLAGVEALPLPSVNPGVPLDSSTLVDGLLQHWPSLTHSLPPALTDFRKAGDDGRNIQVAVLPASLHSVGADLAKWSPDLLLAAKYGAVIEAHPKVWGALFGVAHPARYLMLFQNSGELRASGGLITAWGTVTVRHGHIGHVSPVDAAGFNVHSTIPAPFPFRHYFNEQYLSFENASDNPDVPGTVQTVYALLRHDHRLPPVDGIVFVNTGLVDRLLAHWGSLTVPAQEAGGVPVTLTAKNANVKMEYIAEHSGLSNAVRKNFIGVVMQALLHRVMTAHGADLVGALHTIGAALNHKALVLYLNPPAAEQVLDQLDWAGQIPRTVPGDYLQVVNENLGGHKDNFFLQQHVTTQIQRQGSHTLETTTITWTMPVVANGWLTVGYPGWVEVYVPRGSQLLSMTGAGTQDDRTYVAPAANKTVFAGTFYVPNKPTPTSPPAVRRMVIRYWLPSASPHTILVQLQPGVPSQGLTVESGTHRIHMTQTQDVQLPL